MHPYFYQNEVSGLLSLNTLNISSFRAFNLCSRCNKFIMLNLLTQLLVLLPLIILPIAHGTSVPNLPIVDLGYELHQASSFNVSG